LRKIGQVIHISPSKKAILKAENLPRIGETISDEKKQLVGKVFDLFGPKQSPYVSVDIQFEDPKKLIGKILFSYPLNRLNKRRKKEG
jgi:RNA-binding protein